MTNTKYSFFLLILVLNLVYIILVPSRNWLQPPPSEELSKHLAVDKQASKWIPQSRVQKCKKKSIEELKPWLKSQAREDKILLEWFDGLCGGTYLEMGGLDGMTFSNTYVFNKGFDWTGVLVELSPSNFKKMLVNRPNELATVNAAVCEKKQIIHYVDPADHGVFTTVGGIWEFAADSFKDIYWKNITLEDTTEVECTPLKDILNKTVGEYFYFDFFSLDIEGAEFEALLSLDFSKIGFGIILVEADEHNPRKNLALRSHLEQSGYTFLKEQSKSYWFSNKQFGSIYKDVLHTAKP